MYNYDPPGDGTELTAWYSDGIGAVRVASSPGGVSLDAEQTRALRDELDALLESFVEDENGA